MKDLKQSPSQKKSGLFTQPRLLALGLLTAGGVFSGGACSNGPGQPVATGGSGSISTTCEPACGTGQTCNQGVCQCQGGVDACGTSCVLTQSDPLHCGSCDNACAANQVCSQGVCASTCDGAFAKCGSSCVDINTNAFHCGTCDNACPGELACEGGKCACTPGQTDCGAGCVDTLIHALHCGACGSPCGTNQVCDQGACVCPPGQTCDVAGTGGGGPGTGGNTGDSGGGPATGGGDQGTGGSPVVIIDGRTCPAYQGLIADFEGETDPLALIPDEGRVGLIVANNDGSATQTMTIETEGSEDCNNKVLHTTGSGFSTWGAGVETVFKGTWDDTEDGYVAEPYDATVLGYVGVKFRAKSGPGQVNPVRFSLSTPGTRLPENPADEGVNGNCIDNDPDSACWNHLGQFLTDNEDLTSEWKDFTFCFDRDLHARFMPMHLSPSQRQSVGQHLMTFGFEFNKSTEDNGDENDISQSFDFYVDDIRLVKSGCERPIFESTAGTTQPFGSNVAVGSCQPVPNAASFNAQIGDAYVRWRDSFVNAQGQVVDTENGNKVISEGIGYGMLLSAAMGDRDTFDRIWGWASGRLTNGLLGWDNGGGGSATDADTDIAYALYMADYQWGGYASAASAMASAAAGADLNGTTIKAGSQFDANNPSYFSPGFYRKLGGAWAGAIGPGYTWLNSCDSNFGGGQNGLISDWCNYSGQAQTPSGQVTSETCGAGEICSAYDASRIPWRVGYDVCFDGAGSALAGRIVTKFNTYYAGRIDLLEAGWNTAGNPTAGAVPNEMAFLGTVAVAAWATDNATNRDRAFYAALDLLELREYYKKYYSTSLGLLTTVLMTGNWPVP